jgi:hypothetical protein
LRSGGGYGQFGAARCVSTAFLGIAWHLVASLSCIGGSTTGLSATGTYIRRIGRSRRCFNLSPIFLALARRSCRAIAMILSPLRDQNPVSLRLYWSLSH